MEANELIIPDEQIIRRFKATLIKLFDYTNDYQDIILPFTPEEKYKIVSVLLWFFTMMNISNNNINEFTEEMYEEMNSDFKKLLKKYTNFDIDLFEQQNEIEDENQ